MTSGYAWAFRSGLVPFNYHPYRLSYPRMSLSNAVQPVRMAAGKTNRAQQPTETM